MMRSALAALFLAASAAPGMALTINPIYSDGSVDALANASVVKQALATAASRISSLFSNAAIVNVNVSGGKLAGQSLPTQALGASRTSLYGYFTYAQMKSWLASSASTAADKAAAAPLPAMSPTG